MSEYTAFISQNIAPRDIRRIGIYDKNDMRVGQIPLDALMPPNPAKRLYSFLCVSDCHINGSVETVDSQADFIRAIKYAENDSNIAFTTICGDVVDHSGSDNYYFQTFQNLRNKYATKPVYAITGNHESNNGGTTTHADEAVIQQYFGQPLYYSFTCGNDVFIMLGTYGWSGSYPLFKKDGDEEVELKFLQTTLEANRNKRCFVFFHVLSSIEGDSGEPYPEFYASDLFDKYDPVHDKQRDCFLNMLRHYKNTIWFHGHSHAKFELQELSETNTYSEQLGYRSVHIPSLCKPTEPGSDGVGVQVTTGSQGYIVDVYPDGIHLRGRDFVAGEFLPIASYWIDTTLQTIPELSYRDSVGIINIYEDVPITFHENYTNSTDIDNNYGNLIPFANNIASDIITLEEGYKYIVYGTDVSRLSCNPHWYNANNGFMGNQSGANGYGWSVNATGDVSWIITPPKGAAGVRLQCYADDTSASMDKITVKRVPDATEVRDLHEITWHLGMNLNRFTGDAWQLDTSCSSSDFIPIADKSYTLNTVTTTYLCCSIAYYDANKNFITFDKNAISRYNRYILKYRIPERANAAYMKIEVYTSPVNDQAIHLDKCKLFYLTEND